MRMTSDSILVAHHDRNFKRYFNDERMVTDMTWLDISELVSESGTRVQKLEEALILCSQLGLNVMIDNKVSGLPLNAFEHLITTLSKNDLLDDALMIGSSESTEYFTGKIKLSCTREQLENNMLRDDYSSSNYYLFANPSDEDAEWAHSNNIMIVAVINEWALPKDSEAYEAGKIVENIVRNNIEYVQLDSKYDIYFLE